MLDELSQLRDMDWTRSPSANRIIRRVLANAHSEISQLMEQLNAEGQSVSGSHCSRGINEDSLQDNLLEFSTQPTNLAEVYA